MFQVFHLDVAYTYVSNVSDVFRFMLQVFYLDVAKVDLDVAYVAMVIHVSFKYFICFQTDVAYVVNGYVASVCSKCFICFRRLLQLFHLSVTKVDRWCGGSLSPRWSSCCGYLVW
jgi:hypothetical protein